MCNSSSMHEVKMWNFVIQCGFAFWACCNVLANVASM